MDEVYLKHKLLKFTQIGIKSPYKVSSLRVKILKNHIQEKKDFVLFLRLGKLKFKEMNKLTLHEIKIPQ